MVTSGISDVATTSVHSKKTRKKNMIMIISSMNELQELEVFVERQKLTSAMKQARKVIVDSSLMLDTGKIHREPPEVGFVKKLTGSLY